MVIVIWRRVFCFCVLLRFLMFVALFVLLVCVCGFVFVAMLVYTL